MSKASTAALLERLSGVEEELGPRGSDPVAEGYKRLTISAKDSAVKTNKAGKPFLNIASQVSNEDDADNNRRVFTSIFYFASDKPGNPKPFAERQANLRGMAKRDMMGYAWQGYGNGTPEGTIEAIVQTIDEMNSDDDTVVKEMMEQFLTLIDGMTIIGRVRHESNDQNPERPFVKFQPYVHAPSKHSGPAEYAESWSEGLVKAGIADPNIQV